MPIWLNPDLAYTGYLADVPIVTARQMPCKPADGVRLCVRSMGEFSQRSSPKYLVEFGADPKKLRADKPLPCWIVEERCLRLHRTILSGIATQDRPTGVRVRG